MQKISYEKYETPSDYMRVSEGSNIMRIISDGFISRKHEMKIGSRFIPLGECKGENCENCAKGNVPKLKYTWIVLDRSNKKLRLLDTGKLLGDALSKFFQKNGDPTQYDIEIKRTGMDRNTRFDLVKLETKPLDASEQSSIAINKQYLTNKYLK